MKAIIIGAGISGLAAAVYARQSGWETLILEKGTGPGGLSTSWSRKGYTFEGGIHWLIGAIESIPLHQVWVETGALQENNPVFFKDPVYTLVDGEDRIPLYRDLHGLPVKGLRDRLALLTLRFHVWCFRHFHQPITDLPGLKVKHPRPFSPMEYVRMLPAVLITPFLMIQSARSYAKRFSNRQIRELLAAVVHPGINTLSLIYILSTFASGDSGYPAGGSLRMAANMADTLTYERYCDTHEGSYMTNWPARKALFHAPIRYRRGLYFTGQRTLYSGGLPPAAQSGRLVAQTLCRDFGMVFQGKEDGPV